MFMCGYLADKGTGSNGEFFLIKSQKDQALWDLATNGRDGEFTPFM